jgi:ribose 5-phosphate isomerase A
MDLKRQAAQRALQYVSNGMALGLGTGSTAAHFVRMLGERLQRGGLREVVGVPTSERTAALAREVGVPLTTLAAHPRLDLAVDGADEIDPDLNLVKGLGRALLREKIVAVHAGRFVVVADESKLVSRLGVKGPLPVEIVSFAAEAHLRWLSALGCVAELDLGDDGGPIVTDNGNFLALCRFPDGIADPVALARALAERPGIVEHGLFVGLATEAVVAGPGGVRVMERKP